VWSRNSIGWLLLCDGLHPRCLCHSSTGGIYARWRGVIALRLAALDEAILSEVMILLVTMGLLAFNKSGGHLEFGSWRCGIGIDCG